MADLQAVKAAVMEVLRRHHDCWVTRDDIVAALTHRHNYGDVTDALRLCESDSRIERSSDGSERYRFRVAN